MAGSGSGSGSGEDLHDLQQTPAAPVVEPTGHHGRSDEIVPDEEEISSHAPADTSFGAAARIAGVEMVGRGVGRHGSGEIVSDEEEISSNTSAAPRTAGVLADVRVRQERYEEMGGGLSRSTNRRRVTSENNRVTILCLSPHPICAKWLYFLIYLSGIVLAASSRDMEVSAFSETERIHGCGHDRYCLAAESALRVSLAYFFFYVIMFITTVWTKKTHDWRNFWNSNMVVALVIKVALLAGCIFAVQFIPSRFIQFYGTVARFGAWLFLAIQLISLTRLFMSWNIRQQLITNRWRWLVHAVTILLNFGSFGVILWLLHDHRSNILDLIIVCVTLMLILVMIWIYLKWEVTTSWLAPGLMIAYTVFMCWTVIKSEPHRDLTKAKHPKGADWLTIASFVFVVIVTAYSTLSTGQDHEWLQFNEQEPSEDDIPYGYGYFHLVFALGSMYFGMLLVGWNANQTMERWTMDFGWWSAVVRAVNGLLAAALFIWMLRTPFIWNKRKVVLSWSRASFVPHVKFL